MLRIASRFCCAHYWQCFCCAGFRLPHFCRLRFCCVDCLLAHSSGEHSCRAQVDCPHSCYAGFCYAHCDDAHRRRVHCCRSHCCHVHSCCPSSCRPYYDRAHCHSAHCDGVCSHLRVVFAFCECLACARAYCVNPARSQQDGSPLCCACPHRSLEYCAYLFCVPMFCAGILRVICHSASRLGLLGHGRRPHCRGI